MGLADSYEHGIARGVVRYAKEQGWRLFGYGWMFRPLEDIEDWRGDGIIARVESQADADRIARAGLPVVDVAGAYRGSGFHRVTNDDTATGVQAGRYLSSCGFSRFAFCGVRGVGWSERRREGFQKALGPAARDLPVFEDSLAWWESTQKTGGLPGWVDRLRPPVGVYACNDTAGLKLGELCRLRGLRIPDDVAILGVDNEDILCELAVPSLSSIALDLESIGVRAAELLDRLLNDATGGGPARGGSGNSPPPSSPREILVPPLDVVERDSTRTFTCTDRLVENAVRFIRANAGKPLRVGDVVAALPASRRSLELRFRRALGRSILEEIQRVRLARARALLRTTDARVADVAAEAGFSSPQRFHALFRGVEGCSPADYRRKR